MLHYSPYYWLVMSSSFIIFASLLVGISIIACVASLPSIFRHSFFRTTHATSNHPLTVLLSDADVNIGELDYWINGILSHLGRPIDVQVMPSRQLRLLDDSIILAFNDLQKWTELKARSPFQNVGLLRIGKPTPHSFSAFLRRQFPLI